MDIRCIALDLDRTTLNRQGHLSPENRTALTDAICKGIHIVIASGRAFSTLPQDLLELPGVEYAITSNGAAVYHIPTRRCLRRYTLTALSVEKILALTQAHPLTYEAFVDGIAYADTAYVQDPVTYGASVQAVPYIQSTRTPVEDIQGFIWHHRETLDSIDLVLGDDILKQRLWETLQKEIPDLYITTSVPALLEISHRHAGKHSGVRFVAELLGLSPNEIAAFGDGDNDADMLSYVGCGIAVENATPTCKAAADYVTLPFDQDGVAHAIRNLLHI